MAFVYCEECGREISDKAKFCPNCGYTFKIKGRGFAITSMVLGIIACTYCLPILLVTLINLIGSSEIMPESGASAAIMSVYILILGILSLVFGIVSASKGCKLKKTSAGITLGSISTAVCLICFIINIISVSL